MIKLRVREIKIKTVRCPRLADKDNGNGVNDLKAVRLQKCLSCPYFCGLICSGQYIECSGADHISLRMVEGKNEN